MTNIRPLAPRSEPPGKLNLKIHRSRMLIVLLAILFATSVSAQNATVTPIEGSQQKAVYHGPEDEPLKYESQVPDADGVFRPKPHQIKKRLSNNPSHSDSFENAVSHYLQTGSKRRFL